MHFLGFSTETVYTVRLLVVPIATGYFLYQSLIFTFYFSQRTWQVLSKKHWFIEKSDSLRGGIRAGKQLCQCYKQSRCAVVKQDGTLVMVNLTRKSNATKAADISFIRAS